MITLKHLVLGAGAFRTRPGPYLESWPKIVLFVVVVAVLGSCRDMEPLSLPPLAQQQRIRG
jgi:hypothetical protein